MNIKQRRLSLNLSQSALAAAIGVTQPTVSYAERKAVRTSPGVLDAIDAELTRLECEGQIPTLEKNL